MKALFAFLRLLLIVYTGPAFATAGVAADAIESRNGDWTARSPLQHTSSLHSLIVSDQNNSLQNEYWNFKPECEIAIRSHLLKGGDFSSSVMENTYTLMAEESPLPEVRDLEFFHYTKYSEVFNAILAQDYDLIFNYIHRRQDHTLYVAADPLSSSFSYGKYKVTLRLRKGAKIYTSNSAASNLLDGKFDRSKGTAGDDAVENEQIQKNPSLSVCRNSGEAFRGDQIHPILVLLAAEANHIDLIAYFGVADHWYQMLNSWSIESSTAVDTKN